jgi:hypothetical protein
MPNRRRFIIRHAVRPRAALIIAAIVVGALSASGRTIAASNVVIWDTGTRLESLDGVDRSAWKVVPTELFSLELEPAKAASDPGYYGREYEFRGDAVVENQRLTAIFSSAQGRVVILAKQGIQGIVPPDGNAARKGAAWHSRGRHLAARDQCRTGKNQQHPRAAQCH